LLIGLSRAENRIFSPHLPLTVSPPPAFTHSSIPK
jgi:hypothetical protein